MTKQQLTLGVAVGAALAVIVIFFIFNPFNMQQNPASSAGGVNFGTNASTSGAEGGLVIQDEVVGTGAAAAVGDMVTVNYTGKLANGTVFDTSVGKAPFKFTLGAQQVIPGWDQGLVGMKVGGKRILIIPPSLGYGSQDYGPVPANSTLTFEVELVGVTPAANVAPAPEGPAAY